MCVFVCEKQRERKRERTIRIKGIKEQEKESKESQNLRQLHLSTQ